MANLVSPGYNRSVLVNSILKPSEERVLEFKGLNRRMAIEEGEMSDMKNLTSDNYPLLTPRKLRGEYPLPEGVVVPYKIIARYNKLAMIAKDDENNVNFYFDGTKVSAVTGMTETTDMVAINTKICFFPQKTYIEVIASGNTITVGSFGNLAYSGVLTNASVELTNENAKLTIPAGHDLGYDDAVDIHITSYTPSGGTAKSVNFDISAAIEAVENTNTLILPRESFIEMTGAGITSLTITGTIERYVPDLDMVIEWNNRLWGASSSENTIYACKLGDPRNWHYYQGTSLDSYSAQQGTDGPWTGCGAYSSHIIFFKQNGMARIYGSAPSNYQITSTKCYGVEEGSRGSVVTINDRIFYKSVVGIMAYEGGVPYLVSEKLNAESKYVVGGTEGRKYYASMITKDVGPELMVLDIDRGVWHKEDSARMSNTCSIDNRLYFVKMSSESLKCGNDVICGQYSPICGEGEADSGKIIEINPVNPKESYSSMGWMATFGPFDEWFEQRKMYSKLLLRLVRKADSDVKVSISINEGPWEEVYHFDPAKTGGDYIPIIPRRCDRYSVKIEGSGDCSIKTLTRKVRLGTGGRL